MVLPLLRSGEKVFQVPGRSLILFRGRGVAAGLILVGLLLSGGRVWAEPTRTVPVSPVTAECLDCHAEIHPGIVTDWRTSVHADTVYQGKDGQAAPSSVGCAECHVRGDEDKAGGFEHNGYQVHTVVSPADCAACHPEPAAQFKDNLMAHAYGNLVNNKLYLNMAAAMEGPATAEKTGALSRGPVAGADLADSCLKCHGTKVTVGATVTRQSDLGEMEIPVLSGWPNQGIGRINPDGSKGACTACHPRHRFSRAEARKPETCSQCHKGPDVPAYGVYQVSKHGNIYSSRKREWDFKTADWVPGKHYQAPTCAACHISQMTKSDGEVIVARSHAVSDRLADRLFGPLYAVPHPKSPDLSTIRSPKGLPLPTDLDGTPARDYLIDKTEAKTRRARMAKVCQACHAGPWVDGHFAELDRVLAKTNGRIREATKLMETAWGKGAVDKTDMFDEYLERLWTESWLFYANSIRFSAAMAGADYAVFDRGSWQLMRTMSQMSDLVKASSPPAK